MPEPRLQKKMRRLERQLRSSCFRFQYAAKSVSTRAKLLRRCRAIGQAFMETYIEFELS